MIETILKPMLFAAWPVLIALIIGGALERYLPWRQWTIDRLRWLHAAVLYFFNVVIISLAVPMTHLAGAFLAQDSGWGLLNIIALPTWLSIVLGILILDFFQWIYHWAMHRWPLLWRLHRLHHSDEVIDLSTAFRFHPAETVFRFFLQLAVILAFGIPPSAVFIIGVLVIFFDVWEHVNTPTPRLIKRISVLLMTPDLHRLHHATDTPHQNSNLGTVFTLWDRLLGTYRPGHELDDKINFGLGSQNRLSFQTLADILIDPFRKG